MTPKDRHSASGFCKWIVCLGFTMFFFLNAVETRASEMSTLFDGHEWHSMDNCFSTLNKDLSSRDLYLYANSLWLRGEWKKALDLFLSSSELPPALSPYREMLLILGYERTGQKKKALDLAAPFFDKAPDMLKYYVAYAMARLGGENRLWYSRMLSLAENADQRKAALKGLISLRDPDISNVLDLLKLEPQNAKALSMLVNSTPVSSDMETRFYIGYSFFLKGQFEKALGYLGDIPADQPSVGLRGGYYKAFCYYRNRKYEDALCVWKEIAMKGKSYSASSVRRIAIVAGKLQEEEVIRSLEGIAGSMDGDARLTALYYLSTLYKDDKGKKLEDIILKDFPTSTYAIRSLWNSGWKRWKEDDYKGALAFWNDGLKPGIDDEWRSRLLYWKARAQERLGDPGFKETLDSLAVDYPLSIYTFRAFPNGAWKISNRSPDNVEVRPSLLEEWGFIPYALIEAQRGQSPEDNFRAASMASWLGDGHSSLLSAGKIYSLLTSGQSLSAEGLKLLYPQPYKKTVEKVAARFSVEPALIWSLMRQESAFDPNATSYVGACGLMQLMPATAGDEASKLGLKDYNIYNVPTNVLLGTSHIAMLLKKFRRLDWSVAAYNAGSGSIGRWTDGVGEIAPDEWIEDIPYLETYGYVKKVLSNLYVYRLLYERTDNS